MKVTVERGWDGQVRVMATWNEDELMDVDFDPVDLMQLREPQRDGADILLDAELIVRRLLQRHSQGGGK